MTAVRTTGAQPFAAKGKDGNIREYRLIAIVKASSGFKKLADLKSRRVAHTYAGSNSGDYAPRTYFPSENLFPDIDYKPIMSGGHDRSILGVLLGDYDMAPIASDVFERMVGRGIIARNEFRIIYQSTTFPTSSFAHAYHLEPKLAKRLKDCFFNFKFPPTMSNAFHGDKVFLPVSYQRDWKTFRQCRQRL